jgi:hypothetical protein
MEEKWKEEKAPKDARFIHFFPMNAEQDRLTVETPMPDAGKEPRR